MINKDIKRYKIWYKTLNIIGVLGIIDLATKNFILDTYNINLGSINIGVYFIIEALFGTNIANSLSIILTVILGFWPIWLVIGHYLKRQIKNLENPNEDNLKKIKKSKILMLVILVIFFVVFVWGVFMGMKSVDTF